MTKNTTYLKITTLQEVFFEGEVRSVSLKTKSGGAICLQPNRTSFFSTIDICKLSINSPGDNDYKVCSINGGLVYADATNIKIITDDIIYGANIDIKKAYEEKEEALALLEKYKNTKDELKIELKLKKALNKIEVYNNK
ncbi:F0F1 ATP synthase subunit epsilon [Mycoplasmopsis lipofaciens]|uniref:F0F1 ATP synthase subunit epsilon n=1 Tax=Mycoplasmopsis lipofaciens TaxID=114884 RepID=UPI0004836A56|nr:F0F1 ATP synthase subunit epsilon [Mycoplasmopsis lipofaciens]